MNTWWSLLAIYFTDILLGKGKNLTQTNRENLIKVQVQEGHYQCIIGQHEFKHRHITTYDLTELKRIKHVTNHDIRYKHLLFGAEKSIHELKLNRKKRGIKGGKARGLTKNHQTNRSYIGQFKDTTMYTTQRN